MASVMGCGASAASEKLPSIEKILAPMWHTLPKNRDGRIEWRMLRYIAHRYFMQQSSLLIRGLEPTRLVNASHMGSAEILSKHVSPRIDSALHSKHQASGFTLQDAVLMIATLEQLIFDSESALLETVYAQQRRALGQRLGEKELSELMEAYMVHWMMDGDQRGIRLLMRNRTLRAKAIPHWDAITSFAQGMTKSLEFARQRLPEPGHGQVALTRQYSFQDVHEVAGSITKTFASFWEAQCQDIKESLVKLDRTGTGRVALSDFYGANMDGEWRFGESEAYLRELGALDDSSPLRGSQVIIPNYLLGASNCIVSSPHYLVCCVNECETILNDIEGSIGAPVAAPDAILPLVRNITDYYDNPPQIDAALEAQLRRLASIHGGQVPLHGRLFAQWLHVVFPRECPFPHKAGAASAATLSDFGKESYASKDEVSSHAAVRNESEVLMEGVDEAQRMSQWSEEEEELIADYAELRAPWEGGRSLALGGVAVLALALLAAGGAQGISKSSANGCLGMSEQKAYFV